MSVIPYWLYVAVFAAIGIGFFLLKSSEDDGTRDFLKEHFGSHSIEVGLDSNAEWRGVSLCVFSSRLEFFINATSEGLELYSVSTSPQRQYVVPWSVFSEVSKANADASAIQVRYRTGAPLPTSIVFKGRRQAINYIIESKESASG